MALTTISGWVLRRMSLTTRIAACIAFALSGTTPAVRRPTSVLHSNDVAQWAMGTDDTGPIEIEDLGAEFPPQGDLFNTPTKVAFRALYASGVELVCRTDPRNFGARFEGTEGWLEVSDGELKSYPDSLKDSQLGPDELHLPVSTNHYRNFLDCVKSRAEPIEPVEVGAPNCLALPPGQHRHAVATQAALESGRGAVRGRRRSQRDAGPPPPRAMGLCVAGRAKQENARGARAQEPRSS